MVLHNRFSAEELKRKLKEETFTRKTISFYQYVAIEEPQQFRDELYARLIQWQVFGRIYIAHEGINAQVSVPEHYFSKFKNFLQQHHFLKEALLNIAVQDDGKSFFVLRIKVRPKIVADGIDDSAFDMSKKGKYLDAKSFNKITDSPDTVVVDMRNHYEYEIGHFENAIEIPSDTFREQLPMVADMLCDKKDKPVVMYCTGGIRCEKGSAYLLHRGFKNVYHLKGGIIEYANQAKAAGLKNKFLGKNFVFDERLGEKIGDEIISRCHQCGQPCDTHTNCKNEACHLLFIQCQACAKKYNGCCSEACKATLDLPLEEQKKMRRGIDKGQMIFNKSKQRLRPSIKDMQK